MRIRTHPGTILANELQELGMSAHAFSMAIGVPVTRIGDILKLRRAVTSETALRLARYFGGSPNVWMNMQTAYDLSVAEKKHGKKIRATVRRPSKPKNRKAQASA
jgi:addiction module HigA family antidote